MGVSYPEAASVLYTCGDVPFVLAGGTTTDYKGDTALDTVTAHLLAPRWRPLAIEPYPACWRAAQRPARTDVVGGDACVHLQLHKFAVDYKAKPKSETGRKPFDLAAALKKMDTTNLAGLAGPLL